MPSQMPPMLSISGEVSFIITMSTPGSMPSLRTPITVPSKVEGVVPLVTVRPWTAWSGTRSATGNGVSHEPVAACDGVVMAAVPARQSPAATAAEARTLARDAGFFMERPSVERVPPWPALSARTDAPRGRLVACIPERVRTRCLVWGHDRPGEADWPRVAGACRGHVRRPASRTARTSSRPRNPWRSGSPGPASTAAARLGDDADARPRLRAGRRVGRARGARRAAPR